MAEYIKREDAIKAIQRYGVGCFDEEDFIPEQAERFVIARLNEIPPADVVEVVRSKDGTELNIMEEAIIILEHILEADPRTFKKQYCEYGWIFDKVYKVLKLLKYNPAPHDKDRNKR